MIKPFVSKGDPTMSTEENKALARRAFEEAWNKGNLAVLDQLVAADFDGHPQPSDADFGRGPEGQKRFIGMYRAAFPDIQMTIEDMTAEGDRVAVRWTGRGTHTGELMGMPATGKRATVTGILIDRIAGGKIAESWGNFDALGMLQQLGVVPAPGQAEA
jgi:steroid delta-isomerase-like uncharacterized protein